MTSVGRLHRSIRIALVHGLALGVAMAAFGAGPWATPARANAAARTGSECGPSYGGLRPSALAIGGVTAARRVLERGHDRHGVPRPPPLTERGKWQFAWDDSSGARPGAARGVVRLTAHTYPRNGAGDVGAPALGNLLLGHLRVGTRLRVTGHGGERMCYRVSRRQQVRATDSVSGYYNTTGPHLLAILVCSGTRRGPGDWSHRTIWYATPLTDTRTMSR